MKKLFLASFFALLSLCAYAYDFEVNGIYYNKTGDNTVEVTNFSYNYKRYTGDIVIPNSVKRASKEYSVASIGKEAFWGCNGLTAIDIPASVTSIGDHAFDYCSGLTAINIPASVTNIGEFAFVGCSGLTAIDIPASMTSIGISTFYGCSSLTEINIPTSVTSIGENAFWGCSGLTEINIPASVTSIGNHAFWGCSSLTAIDIPASVTSIGENAFGSCEGLTAIVVANGNSVYDSRNNCNAIIKTRDNSLVSGCKNTVIPASVTSIRNYAFSHCSGLTEINIPASVTSIGENAFSWCDDLTSIVVASGNSVYDSRNNCNAIIQTSDNSLVSGCKNTVIPASVTSIGDHAFAYCSGLTEIDIPASVTSIENYAFQFCSGLTEIDIPASVTSIGDHAFSGCSGLTAIDIPESVTSIGKSAFSGCSRLTAIKIPEDVTSIGYSAFDGCDSLTDIYCYGFTPAWTVFNHPFSPITYSNSTLHVPYGTVDAYRVADGWKEFTHIVEFDPTGVEAVSADRKSTAEQRIYNLGGVRMATPQHGLNIINGKKVVY